MILNDAEIKLLRLGENPVFEPFTDRLINFEDGRKVLSYGVSSYGYDIRLSPYFMRPISSVEPEHMTLDVHEEFAPLAPAFEKFEAEPTDTGRMCVMIPPHGFVLASSVEYIRMPRNVLGICLGKSTYARVGLVCNTTPLEPGWEGHLTLELSNTTDRWVPVYANEGIAQIILYRGTVPDHLYGSRKYQNQGKWPVVSRM